MNEGCNLPTDEKIAQPAALLKDHLALLKKESLTAPILDLACGDGRNGISLASQGLEVILCDHSKKALDSARISAEQAGVRVRLWQVDLEQDGINPFPEKAYGAILIFRYLHRPLIPCLKKALTSGGLLIYETFTLEQPKFGKPRNPDFLLKPHELRDWFSDWTLIHYFEGIKTNPDRAIAQIVCRKPK